MRAWWKALRGLPAGSARETQTGRAVRMPLGWQRRVSYTSTSWRERSRAANMKIAAFLARVKILKHPDPRTLRATHGPYLGAGLGRAGVDLKVEGGDVAIVIVVAVVGA